MDRNYKARVDLCQALLNAKYGADRRFAVIVENGGFYSEDAEKRVQFRKGSKSRTRRSVDEALKMEAAFCQKQTAPQVTDSCPHWDYENPNPDCDCSKETIHGVG